MVDNKPLTSRRTDLIPDPEYQIVNNNDILSNSLIEEAAYMDSIQEEYKPINKSKPP